MSGAVLHQHEELGGVAFDAMFSTVQRATFEYGVARFHVHKVNVLDRALVPTMLTTRWRRADDRAASLMAPRRSVRHRAAPSTASLATDDSGRYPERPWGRRPAPPIKGGTEWRGHRMSDPGPPPACAARAIVPGPLPGGPGPVQPGPGPVQPGPGRSHGCSLVLLRHRPGKPG